MITGKYKSLYETLANNGISKKRMFHDALCTLAYGTDASLYRLVPKLAIRAKNEKEVSKILRLCHSRQIPVTFRAAGTSLSGQSLSDSVLLISSHGWEKCEVSENGEKITLGPGVRGGKANRALAGYGRKLGPDPASIESAMIGGIVANNASGMSCGTRENSYRTIADMRLVFADGAVLDTADAASREKFRTSHGQLLDFLESKAKEIKGKPELREKITHKYAIKNTTGYGLNSLTDFEDGFDILKHLVIGSEGTLAFISEVTFNTVKDNECKATAFVIFNNPYDASNAVIKLKHNGMVTAAEMIDRTGLRSVENSNGVPAYLKELPDNACALLIETSADNEFDLDSKSISIAGCIRDIPTLYPVSFTSNASERAMLWKIRKEMLPTSAGMRQAGTTAIIEDVCFPIERIADAVTDLRELFDRSGYEDAVIYGHALEGNFHVIFNQDFSTAGERDRYGKLMDGIADLVVGKYDGSLKAEHGTGRNMAPFVEKEWGKEAYSIMKEIKNAFDPDGILNPGVIINEDSRVHMKNFKPCPDIDEAVNKCMECGFCEGACASEGLTLSPRQRVAAYREIRRLEKSGEQPHIAAEMFESYKYAGMETCATDSLCFLKCPVGVDAGKLIKQLRHKCHTEKSEKTAMKLAQNMDKVTSAMRAALNVTNAGRMITGKTVFGFMATGARKLSAGTIPQWNEYFPKGTKNRNISNGEIAEIKNESISDRIVRSDLPEKVVYFPSCITRTMGLSKSDDSHVELTLLTVRLLNRAGYEVVFPEEMDKLCCGMAFSSKGYVEAGKYASDKLETALAKASCNGKYPILCDMSPCLYTMRSNMKDRLPLYEPAEFIEKFIFPVLKPKKTDRKVAVFAVCSAKKMGVDNALYRIAEKCASQVVAIESNCCGFAGDRGFTFPELNAHGLRFLRSQTEGCESGYATSRTCEIGLSKHSGMNFRSILYLVEEATR